MANSTDYGDISKLIVDDLNKMAGDGYGEDTYSGIPEWPEIGVLTYLRGKLDESGAMVASSRMRAKLGSLLFSSKRCPISYGTSGRKLAVNRLVRMATGDPKIFQKKVENAAPNSAVAIVLDTSGSMGLNSQLQFGGTTRALVANKTAFALNACLFSLAGVKCCTLEFSNKDRNDGSKCDVNVVCEFGTKPNSERFNINPFDGTPTDQAIWAARGLLLQRPEPRKIILLVTDGEPNDADATDGATTRTERDGIEIAALGIMCDRVKDYWKNNRVINDISDLPQAMFGVMEELLTKRGR